MSALNTHVHAERRRFSDSFICLRIVTMIQPLEFGTWAPVPPARSQELSQLVQRWAILVNRCVLKGFTFLEPAKIIRQSDFRSELWRQEDYGGRTLAIT